MVLQELLTVSFGSRPPVANLILKCRLSDDAPESACGAQQLGSFLLLCD